MIEKKKDNNKIIENFFLFGCLLASLGGGGYQISKQKKSPDQVWIKKKIKNLRNKLKNLIRIGL